MTRSIWIFNQYALPPTLPGGTRHFDLACELTLMGYQVTIFASAFNHSLFEKKRLLNGEPWAIEEIEGVRFVWLPSFPYRNNNWRRLLNMLEYTVRAYHLGLRLSRLDPRIAPPDIIVGSSVHLFAVWAAYQLSRHYKANFVMEIRDLWPQGFVDLGVWHEGQFHVRFFRWLEQWLCERAERIIVLSPLTSEYLARYSKVWADKAVYIPNGTKTARFIQVSADEQRDGGPLRTMFLGSMGYKNGVDLILHAMKVIEQDEPSILECWLIGDGPEKPHLIQLARDLELKNVVFHDAVARSSVPSYTQQADILILVEREVLYGSSNKLFDYLAAGKPIVFSVVAQHNNLADEIHCGLSAAPEDAASLAEKLLEMARLSIEERQAMGERGRSYVCQQHDYSVLAVRLAETFEQVTSDQLKNQRNSNQPTRPSGLID